MTRVAGRRGAGRFGCLLLIVAVALLWGGGQSLYIAMRNRQPTSMTFQEYLRAKPNAEWLELRDVVVYLPGAAHLYSKLTGDSTAAATTLYVPLYAEEPTVDDQPTNVVLKTTDPALLQPFNELARVTGDSALISVYEKNKDRFVAKRTVSGVAQFGIDVDDKDRELIRKAVAHADDFVMLADGDKPAGGWVSALMVAGGVVVLVFAGRQLAKRASQPESPAT